MHLILPSNYVYQQVCEFSFFDPTLCNRFFQTYFKGVRVGEVAPFRVPVPADIQASLLASLKDTSDRPDVWHHNNAPVNPEEAFVLAFEHVDLDDSGMTSTDIPVLGTHYDPNDPDMPVYHLYIREPVVDMRYRLPADHSVLILQELLYDVIDVFMCSEMPELVETH